MRIAECPEHRNPTGAKTLLFSGRHGHQLAVGMPGHGDGGAERTQQLAMMRDAGAKELGAVEDPATRLQDAGVAAEPLAAGRVQEVGLQLEAQDDLALADEAGPDPGVDVAVLLQVPRPDLEEARALPGAWGLELRPELAIRRGGSSPSCRT